MLDETTLLVTGSGSHRAPPPSPPLGGAYYLIGNVSKMNLKVSRQILHSKGKKKKTPFFVPKTVDMLVQHPQDQAINLFSLINKSKRELWASRMAWTQRL